MALRSWVGVMAERGSDKQYGAAWRLAPSVSLIRAMLVSALFVCTVIAPRTSYAVPVTYSLVMASLSASGTFAGKPFSNSVVFLTFEGDTANVIPFSLPGPNGPVTGYVNLVGTASVEIFDENGNDFHDTFLPSAGIYVSVDNTNGGVGFGSFGVPPGNPTFPGQVAYPAAMFVFPRSDVATYDLKSDIALDLGDPPTGLAVSCVGFPGFCGVPLALPMTSGDLILNVGRSSSEFSAVTQKVIPFAKFRAGGEIEKRHFDLRGYLSLGATSNGINPLSEAVTLKLDSYSVTISPGSFHRSEGRGYRFEGTVADVRLRVFLKAHSPTHYTLEIHGAGRGVPRLTKPASLDLTIGDDGGATTVAARDDE